MIFSHICKKLNIKIIYRITCLILLILIAPFTQSATGQTAALQSLNTTGKLHAGSQSNTVLPEKQTVPEFGEMLTERKLKGSMLLYTPKEDRYYSNDFDWAETRRLPASTFKIPNSIIALETGVINSDSSIIRWNGEKRFLKSWEQDLSFRDAFQLSCVPCYQEIARRIGEKRMKKYLRKFDYGAMDVGKSNIDRFWLEGNSGISQMEQIDFLRKFYDQQLPVTLRTSELVKKMMLVHKDHGYSLYGKTGMAVRDGSQNGWYVGFIENQGEVIFFATNVTPTVEMTMEVFGPLRISASVSALDWFLEVKKN